MQSAGKSWRKRAPASRAASRKRPRWAMAPLGRSCRTITVQGQFCGLGANDVIEPIKILVAMDASQSMKVTDPNGDRATALVQLLQAER